MYETVRKSVANGDKETVAAHVLYPMLVNSGKVTVKIDTKEEFVQEYDRIMTAHVRQALAGQEADKLFVNAEGVMAGNGEVWFGATSESPQRYGIITVNAGATR
jgi:cyclopropane fatty-acyl-phospholipid synthase-like methyltransferase